MVAPVVALAIDWGDPTLAAADAALEAAEAARPARGYIGMSGIGDCTRKSYYRFYAVGSRPFAAKTLKNFADGHRTEDLVIQRLRAVDGLTIVDRDPETGRQIEVSDHRGHFLGHLDGEVFGLINSPKTPHVLECKSVSERVFNEFQKLKAKHGEKATLREWNETYFAQAQLYMMYRGRTRHWLVCATAGGRDWDSCRTEFDREAAEYYSARAADIINAPDRLPARIGETRDYYKCRWCEFSEICWASAAPARNCRTCVWSAPADNGGWQCRRHDKLLTGSEQVAGCGDQRYRPALVDGEVTAVDDAANAISYALADGSAWVDGGADV